MNCSLAQTLDVIGERWTLLIVRDAFFGIRRFDQFQRNLGIARNILAGRLQLAGKAAAQLDSIARRCESAYAQAWGGYLVGLTYCQSNRLEEARRLFELTAEHRNVVDPGERQLGSHFGHRAVAQRQSRRTGQSRGRLFLRRAAPLQPDSVAQSQGPGHLHHEPAHSLRHRRLLPAASRGNPSQLPRVPTRFYEPMEVFQ